MKYSCDLAGQAYSTATFGSGFSIQYHTRDSEMVQHFTSMHCSTIVGSTVENSY